MARITEKEMIPDDYHPVTKDLMRLALERGFEFDNSYGVLTFDESIRMIQNTWNSINIFDLSPEVAIDMLCGYKAAHEKRDYPPVLDPCCGSKMFYFDHDDPRVLFCDNRSDYEETLCDGRSLVIDPDVVADVTNLPFEDSSFHLVVFDPPHLTAGASGWQAKKYGCLPHDWQSWMKKAFAECWRVLAPNGTLIFKWYEYRVKLSQVLECAPCAPLFGNRRPTNSKTHWLVFFKEGD